MSRVNCSGKNVWGQKSRGKLPWSEFHGGPRGNCPGGKLFRGNYPESKSPEGNFLGENFIGGSCPGGSCPGGNIQGNNNPGE